MKSTDAVGLFGERVAQRYLENNGYTMLASRWRCEHGEIDLVALDGSDLVICEVKTRRSLHCGVPQESVTTTKLRRLYKLAGCWIDAHAASPVQRRFNDVRIDVVAVHLRRRGRPEIHHLKAVS